MLAVAVGELNGREPDTDVRGGDGGVVRDDREESNPKVYVSEVMETVTGGVIEVETLMVDVVIGMVDTGVSEM
ncbi:hypothetical protein L1887_06480 [Cichorium endivia]|nr:hypothetical protein L1887_06480 [Cichorium endivia]